MSTTLFFSFMGSLVICMALIPALTASAARLRFVDIPHERHVHHAPIAKVGGIAFAIATFAGVLFWAPKDQLILASLLGGAIILLFGVWDDRVNLHYRMKFFGQVLAAAVVVGFAGLRLSSPPFFDELVLPGWFSILLTIVAIVGVTNAVNLADGLDGLAGGLSLMSFTGIAYLAYLADEPQLVFLMVSVLGGLLGFLRFNTYPARIFMGDAGSQFLGHYLAVAAILLTDSTRTGYSPLLALFLWGVPLLDTIGVMGQRLAKGQSPFVGDRNHLHYKLLAIGLSHRQAVTLVYTVHGLMVCCAYLLRWELDFTILAVYGIFACAILSLFVTTSYRPFSPSRSNESDEVSGRKDLGEGGWYSTLPVRLLGPTVLGFLLISVFLPTRVPMDMSYVAMGLFVLVLAGLLVVPAAAPMLVRAGLYVGGTFVIYLIEQPTSGEPLSLRTPLNLYFLALAVLITLTIRFGLKHRFQTTPLDYLMVFLAFAIPFLPEMRVGEINLSVLTAKMIVMFLAFELMLHALAERLTQFGLVSLWVLFVLGLRAWW